MKNPAIEQFENDLQQLRHLIDALPVCISYVDTNYRYQFINQVYIDWFGLPRSAVINKHMAEVIGDEAFLHVQPQVKRALSGETIAYETTVPYQHGGSRCISAQISPAIDHDGKVKGCYAMIIDISQRKKSEEQFHLHEERWQLALEGSGDGVWDWYPQTGIEILSDRLREIYGYKKEDIADLSEELDRRTHPDDLKQMHLDRQAHFDGKTPIYINEHRVQCKDGSWKWILTRGTVIQRDEEGKPTRVVGTHTDISERKQAEVALRESEERLRMALSATHQGLYDLNVLTGDAIVNPEYAHMLGFAHEGFQENKKNWIARVHTEDIPAAARAFREHLEGKSDEYRVEFRQKKASGEWAWILSVGAVVEWDRDGRAQRMLGTVLDITEKKKTEALIWQQANIDTLTGLPNRRMFYDRLDHDIKLSKRNKLALAVLFIDLDFFKEVNDTLGHSTGDALLVEAAHRLRNCVRESDTVARLGGDEFTVSLPEMHEENRAETIAQNIIRSMSTPFQLAGEEIYLSASVGITAYPRDADNLDDLIKHADQAMYAAKAQGRNRFSYFTPGLQTAALARLRMTNDLRTAIAENSLRVYFQPIVDIHSGKIQKAEALVRWLHPQRGFISPMEFIPIAETSGLIIAIGDLVFREALCWVRKWRELYRPDFQISINQSPVEFQGDQERYINWIHELALQNLPGQAISVEITEGLLLDASQKITSKLLQFRDAGIQVALDDFGTGYSSLSYLKKFDIDYLKIDQSFVRNLATDASDIVLPEAIIMMAHKLDLKVIAEGVETQQQHDLLKQAGCDFAQGYLFSKPLPPEEFEMLLQRQKT
ncbi:sensor domain-containing protein [Undibacterium pigrum]|uniref:PAS domain S-box-containing protein/diguanylate cyclase (GGDEF)-like protein n=1 Tax=Undibacterium pigrum TaxID=401470 RepID=A0A318JP60_9BURK|nr:GGDEF and EAL domain-containing protein [Undibacterium pigrum]PXX41993.1 PAS domain S-box-containing protein/diguanylate cyclase (GGDEF)-like protein [Undibacterium pigrum]